MENFKIEVNIGDTLNFSYVGMKIQKIGIKNYKPLKIYMESSVNELPRNSFKRH